MDLLFDSNMSFAEMIRSFVCNYIIYLMGGVQSQQIGQIFNKQDWNLLMHYPNFKLWANQRNPSVKIQQYDIFSQSEQAYRYEQEIYFMRKGNPYIVTAFFQQNQQQNNFCSTSYQQKLFIQNIPIRLTDIQHIPFPDFIHLYNQSLRGFKELVSATTSCFTIDQSYIGINEGGVVKVWLNNSYQKSFVVGCKISEQKMVQELVQLIDNNVEVGKFSLRLPSVRNFMYRNSNSLSFDQAIEELNQYAQRYNNGIIPSRLNCIDKFGGIYTIATRNQNHKQRNSPDKHRQNCPALLAQRPRLVSQEFIDQQYYISSAKIPEEIPTEMDNYQTHFAKNNDKIKDKIIHHKVSTINQPIINTQASLNIKNGTIAVNKPRSQLNKLNASHLVSNQMRYSQYLQPVSYQQQHNNVYRQSLPNKSAKNSHIFEVKTNQTKKSIVNFIISPIKPIQPINQIVYKQQFRQQTIKLQNRFSNWNAVPQVNQSSKIQMQQIKKTSAKQPKKINFGQNLQQNKIAVSNYQKMKSTCDEGSAVSLIDLISKQKSPKKQLNNITVNRHPKQITNNLVNLTNRTRELGTNSNLYQNKNINQFKPAELGSQYQNKFITRQAKLTATPIVYQNKGNYQQYSPTKTYNALQNINPAVNEKQYQFISPHKGKKTEITSSSYRQINIDDGKSPEDLLKKLKQFNSPTKIQYPNPYSSSYRNQTVNHRQFQQHNIPTYGNTLTINSPTNPPFYSSNYFDMKSSDVSQQQFGRNAVSNIISSSQDHHSHKAHDDRAPLKFEQGLDMKYSMLQSQQSSPTYENAGNCYKVNLDPQLLFDLSNLKD